jgi:hypothetical protein
VSILQEQYIDPDILSIAALGHPCPRGIPDILSIKNPARGGVLGLLNGGLLDE